MIILDNKILSKTTFPNKEFTISVAGNSKKLHVVDWFFEENDEIIQLAMLGDLLKGHTVQCNIMYMPYSRMDRAHGTHPFSLKVVTRMLPKGWNYVVVEPHSEVTVKELSNQVDSKEVLAIYPSFNSLIRGLAYDALWANDEIGYDLDLKDKTMDKSGNKTLVVFPDKGAYARARKLNLVDELKLDFGLTGENELVLIGDKKRDIATGKITNIDLKTTSGEIVEFSQHDIDSIVSVRIVDDLVSFGGTFKGVLSKLKPLVNAQVTLHVTHAERGVFQGGLLEEGLTLKCTDSMLTTQVTSNVVVDSLKHTYPILEGAYANGLDQFNLEADKTYIQLVKGEN